MADAQETFRYERKYFSQHFSAEELEQYVLSSSAVFRRQYSLRTVCSMYFDTPQFDYYRLNVIGAAERKKVRVRWYEHDGKRSGLQLEIKLKQGELSRKLTKTLPGSIKDIELKDLQALVRENLKAFVEEAEVLEPVLANSYLRRYFFSEQTGIRMTIDSELSFQTIPVWERADQSQPLPATILECKYRPDQDRHIADVVQGFPLQATKSSKYVMGIASI